MDGSTRPISVLFKGGAWGDVRKITMEPSGRKVPMKRSGNELRVAIREEIDPVDVILRLRR
jgi:hypothetical protein